MYSRRSLQEKTSSETSLRLSSTCSPRYSRLQHKQVLDRCAHSAAPQQKCAHNSLEDWLISRPPSGVYSSDNLPTSAAPATFSPFGPRNCLQSCYPESLANLIENSPTERQAVVIEKLGAAACAIPSCIPVSVLPIPLHLLGTAFSTIHILAIEFRQPVLSQGLQHAATVASELSTRSPSSGLLRRKAIVACVKRSGLSALGPLLG